LPAIAPCLHVLQPLPQWIINASDKSRHLCGSGCGGGGADATASITTEAAAAAAAAAAVVLAVAKCTGQVTPPPGNLPPVLALTRNH